MKKLIVFVSAILLLAGCSSEATIQEAGNTSQAAAGQKDSKSTPESKTKVYAVGDTVSYDNLNITVNAVRTYKDEFLEPENGQFILVDVTFENTGDKPTSVSSFETSVTDADGYQYEMTIVTGSKGSIDGEIAPGKKVRGEIAFDVSTSKEFEFIYGDLFKTGQAIWKITL